MEEGHRLESERDGRKLCAFGFRFSEGVVKGVFLKI